MSLGRTTSLEIRTPEGVSFALPLASPILRCLAWLIDLGVILVLRIIVSTGLQFLAAFFVFIPFIGEVVLDFSGAVGMLLFFVISIGYGMVMEWFWRGQTVGKRVFRLQVVDERGLSLGIRQIVLRNLFRMIDILPTAFYGVGGVACVLNKRCQRLGDLAAGTLVVRRFKLEEPELDQLMSDEVNSFREFPHLEARLRQRVSPEEAQLAFDALVRRNELEPKSRLRVFAAVADHFREAAEFPEEATLGLSDEQYVRNVVETLYRKSVFA